MSRNLNGFVKIALSAIVVALIAAPAVAQYADTSGQVNISGATLFQSFFESPASTLDDIDADNDGFWGNPGVYPYAQQLATNESLSDWVGGTADTHWTVMYRGVGSGNGLAELVKYWNGYPGSDTEGMGRPSDTGLINRGVIWDGENEVGGTKYYAPHDIGGNPLTNIGGAPVVPNKVDIAVMDVPTAWFTVFPGSKAGGAANWSKNPATAGYGLNPITSWDKGQSNQLKSLGELNTDGSDPSKQVFDTQLAWVPISYIGNAGAGVEKLTMDDVQALFTAGRLANGENLQAATRDSGSGTRNGAMSTSGIDPSWGRGDNMGKKNKDSVYTRVGINYSDGGFKPHSHNNNGGSSVMESAVENNRLAIGYTGVIGSSRSNADAAAGKYEVLTLTVDDSTGSKAMIDVRPEIAPIVLNGGYYTRPGFQPTPDLVNLKSGWVLGETEGNGGNIWKPGDPNMPTDGNLEYHTGWTIGGPETMAHVGNPMKNDISAQAPADPAAPGLPMTNQAAAAYLRNLTGSLAQFTGDVIGGGDPNNDTPGAYLARNFVPMAGLDLIPSSDPGVMVANPDLNEKLQKFMLESNMLQMPEYDPGSKHYVSRVPERGSLDITLDGIADYDINGDGNLDANDKYSDGSVNGDYLNCYSDPTTQVVLSGGDAMPTRSMIAGDFDGIGGRTVDDIDDMVAAVADPTQWAKDNPLACPEILGDHNSDGNLDDADVRYAADGLVLTAGQLDRIAGFTAVDAAAKGNYFGTTGWTQNGDSRFDVAGSDADVAKLFGATPGAGPNGADGAIDETDYHYVALIMNGYLMGNTGAVSTGSLDWANADDRPFMDLSCDMDGDLDVDAADLSALGALIGRSSWMAGDANNDGAVDVSDLGILSGNWNASADQGLNIWYRTGDFSEDGKVDVSDLGILAGAWGSKGAAVPEPTTMILLGLGGLAAITRRRK